MRCELPCASLIIESGQLGRRRARAAANPTRTPTVGFAHGDWSHPFVDPEVMGGAYADAMADDAALLFGRRTWQTMGAASARAGGRPVRRPDERHPEATSCPRRWATTS